MPVTAGALLTSVCVNGSIGLGCLCLFGGLRKWKVTEKLYEPKRYTGADTDASQRPARLATPLPQGLLSWTRAVWTYPESDVISQCGMDVAVFFRLLHLGVKLSLFLTLWCCLLVMPVNLTGGYLERHKRHRPNTLPFGHPLNTTFSSSSLGSSNAIAGPLSSSSSVGLVGNFTDAIHTNLDLLTLSNVPPGSPRMWVHLASVYVITLIALKWLWDLSRDVAFKRSQFLATQASSSSSSSNNNPSSSSVLVTDIPGLEWGTPLNRLQLSWIKWLLPAGIFRRGFDQQHQQQHQQRRRLVQRIGDAAAGLQAPLLPQQQEQGEEEIQDVWHEAVDTLQHNGGDVKALVEQEMCRVYGADSVEAVVPVYNTNTLDAAAARYWQLAGQFEDVLDWYQCHLPRQPQQPQPQHQQQQEGEGGPSAAAADVETGEQQHDGSSKHADERQHLLPQNHHKRSIKRKTVMVVGPRHGAWGIERYGVTPCKVDALEFYTAALQQQMTELRQLQHAAMRQLPRPAAFVTFRSQLTATLACSSLHSYDEAAWSIGPAPQPQEVEWSVLGVRSWELVLRQLAVWGVFWLLVLFYAPIVAAIQAPVNMDNLSKVPILADLINLPLVSSLIQGFLPSLVLLIFLAVAPYLLKALIQRAGLSSMTAIDKDLISLYFLFQLFAVFIFSFISGTALSQLQGLIEDPHRIVSLLGVSAPQQASFFSTWTLLLGLSRTPLQLLRLPQLVWYLLRLQLADTPRQRQRLWSDQQQLLGYVLPLHTLVLLLGLVFCVASPLIAPVTFLYFVSASVTQRYQWLYVYKHPYEGAGTLWQQVFNQVLVAVYFFVAVMGCLLGIKRFEYALLLLPLAVGVLVFHVLAGRALQRPLTLPTAREAAAVDHNRALQHDHAQAGPNSQPSKAPLAAAVLSAVQAALQATGHATGSSGSGTNQHPAGSSSSDENELQLSSTTGASSSLKRGAVGTEESQPALETTGVNAEGEQRGGGEAGSSSAASPEVTRRTAGDVNRAFGQAPPEDLSELYLAPSLKLAQQHLQPLLDEATDIQQRLAALGW